MEKLFKFISRNKLEERLEERLWEEFLKRIEKAGEKKELASFLNKLLTEKEKKILVRRLMVASLIREEKSYKEISRILWISPSTISSIKKDLTSGSSYGGRKQSKRKISWSRSSLKIKENTIWDYWLNFPMPKMVSRGRWRFLNEQG